MTHTFHTKSTNGHSPVKLGLISLAKTTLFGENQQVRFILYITNGYVTFLSLAHEATKLTGEIRKLAIYDFRDQLANDNANMRPGRYFDTPNFFRAPRDLLFRIPTHM